MSDLTYLIKKLRFKAIHDGHSSDAFFGFCVDVHKAADALEAQEARIAELVSVLSIVQPLFVHALDVCNGEGIGPSQDETDEAERMIENALTPSLPK